jgi:replicative DNA helicase
MKIDKFIDTIELDEWEVETDTGWSDIKVIGKTIEYEEWVIETKNHKLICADDHIVFKMNLCEIFNQMNEIYVKNLNISDCIMTENGPEKIIKIYKNKKSSNMYDLQLDDKNHRFYSNGILSHNSMWMQNIGVNSADIGKVVVIITLEMSSRKVMKRLGSMRLKIDIDQYNELSKDSTFIKNKINQIKSKNNGIFNVNKPGKIYVKKYNTSDCSILDIDNYINKLQETKKIKVDMILVDYINIMSVDSSSRDIKNNLYQKGKHLAEGLRYIADKYECVVITATQLDRAVWGANDVKLNDIPESKAIAETADSVWAIIRTPTMKKENKYRLKILKLRDGEHKEEQIKFDFNTKYLTIENDTLEGTI